MKEDKRPLWFIEYINGEQRVCSYCLECGQTHIAGPRIIWVSKDDFQNWGKIGRWGKIYGPMWPILVGFALYIAGLTALAITPNETKALYLPDREIVLFIMLAIVVGSALLTWLPLAVHNRRVQENREVNKRAFLARFERIPPGRVHDYWVPGMGRYDFMLIPKGVSNQVEFDRLLG